MSISRRIRELRESRGISQQNQALQLGLSKSSYNRYETGLRQPPVEVLQNIASAYNVSIDYLVNGQLIENIGLTPAEKHCLELFRAADMRAQNDAMHLLANHAISGKDPIDK